MPKRSLRERRELLGLSQRFVAHLAGLLPNDVSMAETGKDRAGWRARKLRRAVVEQELLRRKWRHLDQKIARQRAVWNDLPDGESKERLIEMLADAAWGMLDAGRADEADVILFLLPEAVATKLLDEFFFDAIKAVDDA